MSRSQRRSREQWKSIIKEQESSGQSAKDFCSEESIGVASFYQWRRRLKENGSEAERPFAEKFIEVGQLGPSRMVGSVGSVPWLITLDLGDGLKLTLQRG